MLLSVCLAELTVGRAVGQGGFSDVRDVVAIDLDEVYDTDDEQAALRRDFCREQNQRRFVIKSLRTDLPEDDNTKGILDLAVEAEFLATLDHPGILAMRAMANSDPHAPRFFVVLDKLSTTLERKFNYWRKLVGEHSGKWIPCWGYCCANGHALHAVWKERIGVAADIAAAMDYLHQNKIIFRDLKPDNIGFTANGDVKVFDFGLAKRLNSSVQESGDFYLLTGNTGSLRYMAPEVAMEEPYDYSVDAYSFGIMFWQICSLTTPFAGYSQKMHAELAVRDGQRPEPDPSWPSSWTSLMSECWTADKAARPSFQYIVEQLNYNLEDLELDDGVVPSRASDIRAKKRRKKKKDGDKSLDFDPSKSTSAEQRVVESGIV